MVCVLAWPNELIVNNLSDISVLILLTYCLLVFVVCFKCLGNQCTSASCFLLFSQSLSEKLARKEKEYQKLEENLGAEISAKKAVQDSLRKRDLEVQELQARATGAEASLQKAETELTERAEEMMKLKSEIAELEVKHAEMKVERKQLEQQKEEKESQGAQQQTEISQVSEVAM